MDRTHNYPQQDKTGNVRQSTGPGHKKGTPEDELVDHQDNMYHILGEIVNLQVLGNLEKSQR